jgi:hypothetical protein
MGLAPTYWSQGQAIARYILEEFPNGRIAILWQNDDAGKEQVQSVKTGLGDRAGMMCTFRAIWRAAILFIGKCRWVRNEGGLHPIARVTPSRELTKRGRRHVANFEPRPSRPLLPLDYSN